jgi:hypothetical protein
VEGLAARMSEPTEEPPTDFRRLLRVVGTIYLVVFGLPALAYLLVTGIREGTLWRWEGIVILMWRG